MSEFKKRKHPLLLGSILIGFDEEGVPCDQGGLPLSDEECTDILEGMQAFLNSTTAQEREDIRDRYLKEKHPRMYEQMSSRAKR